MSALEVKEKELNKLRAKVDTHLKSNHPASDKIEVRNPAFVTRTSEEILHSPKVIIIFLFQAYRDTLQTQWSWLLQITKCIDVHLKENAAYNQVQYLIF